MTKKFVYQVVGFEWVDTEPFGWAWREAKAKAAELNTKIYRMVIKGDEIRQEYFADGGCFLLVK